MDTYRSNLLPEGSCEKIIALRRFMHVNPELSNQEHKTKAKILEMLRAEGVRNVGTFHGTGIYVDIVGYGEVPVNVVVRGDIDALPIQEDRPDLEYQSTTAGLMHACGHDAHAAAAFGTVLAALANRHQFGGKVRVIFQPAEEAEPLGGRTVANDGLLDGFDYAVGLHVNPEIPSGKFGVLAGPVSKSADEFEVIFTGKNSHAAMPELGVDAIVIASSFVNEVQKLVSRESFSEHASTISIGRFHGGEATNIVCDRVVLNGTIRTRSASARTALHERLLAIADGIARMHRGEARLTITKGEPPVINDLGVSELVRSTIVATFGENTLHPAKPMAGADDFGFYSETLPSVYFWIGCFNESANNVAHVHNPRFGVADADVLKAAEATWAVVKCLQRQNVDSDDPRPLL